MSRATSSISVVYDVWNYDQAKGPAHSEDLKGSDNHFGNLIDQAANSFLVNSEYARIIPYPDQRISLYHRW
jgi:hypothetical protein